MGGWPGGAGTHTLKERLPVDSRVSRWLSSSTGAHSLPPAGLGSGMASSGWARGWCGRPLSVDRRSRCRRRRHRRCPRRDRPRRHRGGSLVNVPHVAEHPPDPQTGGQAVLPRRFRSSALRACGAGRLANGIPGQHTQYAARNIVTVTAPIGRTGAGSYPQFVVMVHDATSAWGVALNTLSGLKHHACRVVGSSLVSSACVRPRSSALPSMRRCRSRTYAGLDGLVSRVLKIGRAVRPRPWPPHLTRSNVLIQRSSIDLCPN